MIYAFGDCVLDTSARELWRNRSLVHIQGKVFEVLIYLIYNRDRAVRRDELMQQVWNDYFISDVTLAACIKKARQAINDSGSGQRYIRTVHGYGYHWVAKVTEHNDKSDALTSFATDYTKNSDSTVNSVISIDISESDSIIEDIRRGTLHPIDEAKSLGILIQKYNYTQEKLAKVVGKARSTVTELLRLTTLSKELQDLCRTSDISKSALIEMSRLPTPEQQYTFWENVNQGGMSVRASRAKRKGLSPHNIKKTDGKMINAGRKFVEALQEHASHTSDKNTLAEESLRELQDLRTEIINLMNKIAVEANVT